MHYRLCCFGNEIFQVNHLQVAAKHEEPDRQSKENKLTLAKNIQKQTQDW